MGFKSPRRSRKAEKMKGFVYIAVNESLPNLVKIGYSDRHPDHRMQELSNTSIPHPFECAYSAIVDDPYRLEQLLHRELDEYRVTPDREYFKLSPANAVGHLEGIAKEHDIEIISPEKNQKIFWAGEDEDDEALTHSPMTRDEIDSAAQQTFKKITLRINDLQKSCKENGNLELRNDLLDIEVEYINWQSKYAADCVSWLVNHGPIFLDDRHELIETYIFRKAEEAFPWLKRLMAFIDTNRYAAIPRGEAIKFRLSDEAIRKELRQAAFVIENQLSEIIEDSGKSGNEVLSRDAAEIQRHYLNWRERYLQSVKLIDLRTFIQGDINTQSIFQYFEQAVYEEFEIDKPLSQVKVSRDKSLSLSFSQSLNARQTKVSESNKDWEVQRLYGFALKAINEIERQFSAHLSGANADDEVQRKRRERYSWLKSEYSWFMKWKQRYLSAVFEPRLDVHTNYTIVFKTVLLDLEKERGEELSKWFRVP